MVRRAGKPRLLVEHESPDRTVAALRDILAGAPNLFERGVPVRLAVDRAEMGGAVAQPIAADDLVLLAHQMSRPYALKERGIGREEVDVLLPNSIARMYLGWRGEWRLRRLNGIASAPLLRDDGAILSGNGYDPSSGIWRERLPDLSTHVPHQPTSAEALAALRTIRQAFRTSPFADARTISDPEQSVPVVDLDRPPERDESGFLIALLTAACRPSLPLAPGLCISAPSMSGAGTGKGLLVRSISLIAFGREPHAVTSGATGEELEKRIAAELIQAHPVLFLDNLNNCAFRSNLLASAITEQPSRVRLLGRSKMVELNAAPFVVLTGNGLRVSEDLARRFLSVNLDAKIEDPETRRFGRDIKADVAMRRLELLAALLTIWRFGRQGACSAADVLSAASRLGADGCAIRL